jgi:hypothetical protein
MRFVSRAGDHHERSNVFTMSRTRSVRQTDPELTAFRGLLIAATASALFWGACITAIWLLRSRH